MQRQPRGIVHRSATAMAILVVAFVAINSSAPVQAADPRVTVTRAESDSSGSSVTLEGTSDPYGTVLVTDADSGNVLATTTATAGGTWSETVTEHAVVPCRVLARSGGGVAEANVVGYSGICGPQPLTIAAADWDTGTDRLVVSGQSDSYRRIVVRDADSGAEQNHRTQGILDQCECTARRHRAQYRARLQGAFGRQVHHHLHAHRPLALVVSRRQPEVPQ